MSNIMRKVLSLAVVLVMGVALLLGVVLTSPGVTLPDVAAAVDSDNEINLTDSSVLHWVVAVEGDTTGSDSDLRDGRIYKYVYRDESNAYKFYYTVVRTDNAPKQTWTDWRLDTVSDEINSIVRFRSVGYQHHIALHSDLLNVGFTVDYDDTTTALDQGMYTTKATLTANEGYVFSLGGLSSDRKIDITISSDGKEAVITKVWYVANFDNALLDGDSSMKAEAEVEFTIPSWKFGEYETVEFPWLYHGDGALRTQDDKWTLNGDYDVKVQINSTDYESIISDESGVLSVIDAWNPYSDSQTDDIVTFTLKRGNTIYASDVVRSKWSYYINECMPVGDYQLTISVKTIMLSSHKHWWDGTEHYTDSEEIYAGFVRTFNFSVTPGDLKITNEDLFKDTTDYVNIDDIGGVYTYYNVFKSSENIKLQYQCNLDYKTIVDMRTYWTSENNGFFDEAPHLEYNLYRMRSDDYYTESKSDIWAQYITTPSTYIVYYRVTMKNYASYPSTEDRYEHYYSVNVFKEVPVPGLVTDTLVYTGEERTVSPVETGSKAESTERDMSLYTWTQYSATNVGDYTVKFTLIDSEHYKWINPYNINETYEFGDIYTIDWHITPAVVVVPEIASRVYRGVGIKPAITIPTNIYLGNQPIFTSDCPNSGFVDAGDHEITLKLISNKNYVWAEGDPEKTGEIKVIFTILPEDNMWIVTPRIRQWSWGSYNKTVNVIEGAPMRGNVQFSICYDSDGNRAVDGLDNITLVNGVIDDDATAERIQNLSAGDYYLIAQVEKGKNYTELKPQAYKFEVTVAQNYWESSPNIIRWKYDGFDVSINLITAVPHFGSVVQFSIVSARGNIAADDVVVPGLENIIVNSNGEVQGNAVDILAKLDGGSNRTYWLKAVVEPQSNYTKLEQYVEFHIQQSNNYWTQTPNIQRWIEGEDAFEPTGTAMWGVPKFVIYRENTEEVLYDSSTGLNKLNNAKPGWHVLESSVAGNDNYTSLASKMRFQVFSIDVNFWKTVPNIQGWTEGSTPSSPVANAAFGTVVYSYYYKADYDANGLDAQKLDGVPTVAGDYVLVAIAESPEYADLVAIVDFTIYKKVVNTVYLALIGVLSGLLVIGIAVAAVLIVKGKKNAQKLAMADGSSAEDVDDDVEVESEEFAEASIDEEDLGGADSDVIDVDGDDDAPALEPTSID